MRPATYAAPSNWLTTADVARMLERSPWSVRWMARTGRLPCEVTRSGQHLFRPSEVYRLADQRVKARMRSVYVGRPKRWSPPGTPRQVSLFRAPLRLVAPDPSRKDLIHGSVDSSRGNVRKTG